MQTQCPQCETRFRLTEVQLNAAEGNVRCGLCDEVFNAQHTESPKEDIKLPEIIQKESEQDTSLTADDNTDVTPDETQSSNGGNDNVIELDTDESGRNDHQDEPDIESSNEDNTENENKETDADTFNLNELDIDNPKQENDADTEEVFLDEHASNFDADVEINPNDEQEQPSDLFDDNNNQDSPQIIPDELREEVAANDVSIGKNIAWFVGILLLSTTLLLQYFWLNRDQFVQHPSAQALIEKTCLKFDCSKLIIRDPSDIELITRNVFSHPNEKNTLMISIALQNNAKFSQPYPVLQINFSDIRGDDVVARRFTPVEYLGATQEKPLLLQPGTDASFNLEIQDPGKQAITYEFNFL